MITVIIIDDSNPLTLNPLTSKIGEGINYDYIKNPNQLTAKIDFIFESRRKNPEKFLENSNELKLKFFSKISEESLKKDFDI